MFSRSGDRRARRGRRLSAALVLTAGVLLLPAGLAGTAATPAQALVAPPPPPPPPPDPYAPCLSTESQDAYGSYFENFYSNVVANDPFSRDDQLLPFCAPDDPPPPDPLPGAVDVAFGDSYISGEGARNGFDANAPGGAGCDVSTTAWSSLLHPADLNLPGFGFENWACTGASIADATTQVDQAVAASQDPSNPFWGVGAGTNLVQISIGGNDLGFRDILSCAWLHDLTRGLLRSNHYRSRGSDGKSLCIPDDATLASEFVDLTPKLIAFYRKVAEKAPNATIEVAGYPMIFPQDGSHCREGLTQADEQAGNHLTVTVDDHIHDAVQLAGLPGRIRYLDFSTALAHANVCGQHGVNTVLHSNFTIKGLYHPNEIGHRALADAYSRLAVAGFPSPVSAGPPPPDGSIIGDVGSDTVWAMAGGAKINIGSQGDLDAAGYAGAPVSLVPTDLLNSLPTIPGDGTLLRDASTGAVYVITGGSKSPSGATTGAVTVPAGYLADIPDAASASAPAVLGDPTGVRQVFFNSGGQLVMMSTDAAGTWSGPVTLAANITGSPAATGDPGGVMEVFFNSDGQLQHMRYENGAWGAPEAIGGPITGNPAVVRNTTGLLEVYFSSGGQLNVVWWENNQWNGPAVLGGPITGSPAAIASTTTSAREVYFNSGGQLDAMWVDAANSGWNGPGPLGAAITGSPMAMGNPSGARQVFFNSGGQLNEMWVDTTVTQWNGPLNFGVPITGTPAGLGTILGPWEVYFNSGGQLNVLWQAGHKWNGPGVIAGSITGSPAAIAKYTNGSREILYPSGSSLATMWITTGNWTGPAAVYAP